MKDKDTSVKVYKLSINVSEEEHHKIKLLALLHKKSIKRIVLEGIDLYSTTHKELDKKDRTIKDMKHRLYMLEYSSHDDDGFTKT